MEKPDKQIYQSTSVLGKIIPWSKGYIWKRKKSFWRKK
jgi:hypothetical protein